jgi:hypothetical protein
VRHAWQQGGDPLIGSNGAARSMPAGAAAGRRAHCNLWSAPSHRRHTYATVLPATIDGIRAHLGNPTQITLLRMPVSAGSLHEKTVQIGGSARVSVYGAAGVRRLTAIRNQVHVLACLRARAVVHCAAQGGGTRRGRPRVAIACLCSASSRLPLSVR